MLKNKEYRFEMLEGEYWWGGACFDGCKMPFYCETSYHINLDPNPTNNQSAPLLLSSKGRFIWSECGFDLTIESGMILIQSSKDEPKIFKGYHTLKGAYLAASKLFFPSQNKMLPLEYFNKPQFNTWIELTYNQEQDKIIEYASNIAKHDFSCSIFMIDCGWQKYYGNWTFKEKNFPNPKLLMDTLHGLGFKVLLWSCPFISADSMEYRYLRDRHLLVCDKNGDPSIKKWWDGFSAVLDLTHPEAVKWYLAQNQKLIDEFGVDGFKLDAGDGYFYDDDDVTYSKTDANGECELWAKIGLNYDYNEYRACFKCGGLPLAQRLNDKLHEWNENGVSALVPSMLASGLLGHAFTCPDMIGGGDYLSFSRKRQANVDQELFVRYAQSSALMPMMQFSAAPWRILDEKHLEMTRQAVRLHEKYASQIIDLAKQSAKDGQPIVRYLAYVFPNENLELVNDQFMLGDDILVAPVCQKGMTTRNVRLPKGKWKMKDTIYGGGTMITIDSPQDLLPIFTRIE